MNITTVLADFAALPPQAQQEAADFIAFLRERHAVTRQPVPQAGKTSPAGGLSFRGMWKDREDMRDATAWVTALRRSDWKR